MATSGTYDFAPSNGELALYALNMCRVRNTAVTEEHLLNVKMATNLMLANWSNRQVNLWKVDLVEMPLLQGITTYPVDAKTVMILDAYIRSPFSAQAPNAITDRLIFPISRTEYASFPNKTQEGIPTVFWFDRLINPEITLWQVPDADLTYTLRYYRVTQTMDSNLQGSQNPDIPYRWLEPFAFGIAARLAIIYAQDLAAGFAALAEESWKNAAGNDVENVSLFIQPMLGGYFVR